MDIYEHSAGCATRCLTEFSESLQGDLSNFTKEETEAQSYNEELAQESAPD